jgi:NADPH:quinone reductase-like Zn-dependent oxidoreductase
VRVVPTQVPGENEVLVRVAAIGINPTDWKSTRQLRRSPGRRLWVFNNTILGVRSGKNAGKYSGCDFAGEIIKIGPNPKVNFTIGDRVSASVTGSKSRNLRSRSPLRVDVPSNVVADASTERGAFSQYAKAFSDLVWKIPEGTFSFEDAVTTGVP